MFLQYFSLFSPVLLCLTFSFYSVCEMHKKRCPEVVGGKVAGVPDGIYSCSNEFRLGKW